MPQLIEKSHATAVNKCFWILFILAILSNPVKAFNSACLTSRKRVSGSLKLLPADCCALPVMAGLAVDGFCFADNGFLQHLNAFRYSLH